MSVTSSSAVQILSLHALVRRFLVSASRPDARSATARWLSPERSTGKSLRTKYQKNFRN